MPFVEPEAAEVTVSETSAPKPSVPPSTTAAPTTQPTTGPTATAQPIDPPGISPSADPQPPAAAPRHRLPDGVAETTAPFEFRRTTDLRIVLADDLATCGDTCGQTELRNDGTRARVTYDNTDVADLGRMSDVDLTRLLSELEGLDLTGLVRRSFAPGDWLQNGPRLIIADSNRAVVLPPLDKVDEDNLNASLDGLRALNAALQSDWVGEQTTPTGIVTRTIPGGRAIDVNYWETPISAGPERCGTASINANWLTNDRTGTYGLAVFDGVTVPGSFDDNDRGIFGERRGAGADQEEFDWDFTGRARINVLSNMAWRDGARLQLHSNYWSSALWGDQNLGWDWAVGGITLMTDGNFSADMSHSYTFNTRKHPFVAFKPPSTITFGATLDMTALELTQYLQGEGYTDVMKFDGGGSVEMNEGGVVTVGGTDRPITVWLGLGC